MSASHYLARGLDIKWRGHRHLVDVIIVEHCDADENFEHCPRVIEDGDLNAVADAVEKIIGYVPNPEA